MATASSSSTDVLHTVYLALGSNIGNRKRQIQQAISMIDEQVGAVQRVSSLIETEPWGFSSPNKFINCCLCCVTALTPRQLLIATQNIEIGLGRTEKSADGGYHDRVIDIDILYYDDETVDEPDLKIPHPHIEERDFVTIPLKEIMPKSV